MAGGSASRNGEARRQRRRQGRAKRMPRQGGLRVGVGGAVQSNRTTQPTQDPTPQTPAAARAGTAKPGAKAPARQSKANAAPGRITGGGGRGGSIKPYNPTHSRPDPPNTRGSASRNGEVRRQRRRQGRGECRAREDYGWGWAGRFNQAVQPNPLKTRPPNTRGSASPQGAAPCRAFISPFRHPGCVLALRVRLGGLARVLPALDTFTHDVDVLVSIGGSAFGSSVRCGAVGVRAVED